MDRWNTMTYGGNGYGGSYPLRLYVSMDTCGGIGKWNALNTDPTGYGTNGIAQAEWDEVSAGDVAMTEGSCSLPDLLLYSPGQ